MAYYIKRGQNFIFQNIKFYKNECHINIKKKEKVVKKIKKKKIDQVVLSNELKKNQEFIVILNNQDITILDGKWLMQYMLQEIIGYLKKKQKITEDGEIAILVNDLTSEVKQNIKEFANSYKKIKIVTNHLERFKKIEEELYETQGISIIISNNKRKALAKSMLIVNFDFVQEVIDKYNINENAVIINLSENIRINKKRFCGVVTTDYEVEFEQINKEDGKEILNLEDILEKQNEFSLKEVLEEQIHSSIGKYSDCNIFLEVRKIIKRYNIQIKELFGINGILS